MDMMHPACEDLHARPSGKQATAWSVPLRDSRSPRASHRVDLRAWGRGCASGGRRRLPRIKATPNQTIGPNH
eukprot:1686537-Pleurochrysis_carterae.AAC.1